MNRTSSGESRSARTFAERLRDAVNETTTAGERVGRHRARRAHQPVFSATANPGRVRYSDELFVDRVRHAMD